jgi:hypothetical protein
VDIVDISRSIRGPRFKRAAKPIPFRLTDGDVEIVKVVGQHRFVRSTHVAALVNRSVDRANDRLCRLFHAGYLDRPRAQLDYYPTSGSAPMVYALADTGADLLSERFGAQFAHLEWSWKNRDAGRPFIEHQLEIVDFYVRLELATRGRTDIRLIHSDELIAGFPEQSRGARNPLTLRVNVANQGTTLEIGLVPDLAFGLRFTDSSRRCFMVEIDRGTMPISRGDITQTSFERKMRAYLTAHANKQHESRFGWKTFRVLAVTTDNTRMNSMIEALRVLHISNSPGASLFFFAIRDQLRASDPLAHAWRDGNGREVRLT